MHKRSARPGRDRGAAHRATRWPPPPAVPPGWQRREADGARSALTVEEREHQVVGVLVLMPVLERVDLETKVREHVSHSQCDPGPPGRWQQRLATGLPSWWPLQSSPTSRPGHRRRRGGQARGGRRDVRSDQRRARTVGWSGYSRDGSHPVRRIGHGQDLRGVARCDPCHADGRVSDAVEPTASVVGGWPVCSSAPKPQAPPGDRSALCPRRLAPHRHR